MSAQYIGKDGFYWWLGVIESRNDPLNLGRYKVRIFGWHTDNLSYIKTEDLPWAIPINPVNGSMLSATAQEGDYAFGFFLDNVSGQAPAILGVFPGIPQEGPNQSKGFSDARTPTQLQNSPRKPVYDNDKREEGKPELYPNIIGEPSTSRLYRNEEIFKTFIGYKLQNVETDVPSVYNIKWNEPETEYAADPPYNRVLETESGHIMEFDDTPGSERIHTAHRSGTFEEIFPDGTVVRKIVNDNYEIVAANNKVLIKGDCFLTVDKDSNIYIKGNTVMNVDGSLTHNVKGDYTINTDKGFYVNSENTVINASKNASMNGQLTAKVTSTGAAILHGTATATVSGSVTSVSGDITSVSGTGMLTLSSIGLASLSATGLTRVSGAQVMISGLPIGGSAAPDSLVSAATDSAETLASEATEAFSTEVTDELCAQVFTSAEGAASSLTGVCSGILDTVPQTADTLSGFLNSVTTNAASLTGSILDIGNSATILGNSVTDQISKILSPSSVTSFASGIYGTLTAPLFAASDSITKNLSILSDAASSPTAVFNAASSILSDASKVTSYVQTLPSQLPSMVQNAATAAISDTTTKLIEATTNEIATNNAAKNYLRSFTSYVDDIKANILNAPSTVQNAVNKALDNIQLDKSQILNDMSNAASIARVQLGSAAREVNRAALDAMQSIIQKRMPIEVQKFPITTLGIRG